MIGNLFRPAYRSEEDGVVVADLIDSRRDEASRKEVAVPFASSRASALTADARRSVLHDSG